MTEAEYRETRPGMVKLVLWIPRYRFHTVVRLRRKR